MKFMTQGPDSVDREDFVDLLVSKGNMTKEEAENKITDMTNKYNETRQRLQQGLEMGGEVGKTASVSEREREITKNLR